MLFLLNSLRIFQYTNRLLSILKSSVNNTSAASSLNQLRGEISEARILLFQLLRHPKKSFSEYGTSVHFGAFNFWSNVHFFSVILFWDEYLLNTTFNICYSICCCILKFSVWKRDFNFSWRFIKKNCSVYRFHDIEIYSVIPVLLFGDWLEYLDQEPNWNASMSERTALPSSKSYWLSRFRTGTSTRAELILLHADIAIVCHFYDFFHCERLIIHFSICLIVNSLSVSCAHFHFLHNLIGDAFEKYLFFYLSLLVMTYVTGNYPKRQCNIRRFILFDSQHIISFSGIFQWNYQIREIILLGNRRKRISACLGLFSRFRWVNFSVSLSYSMILSRNFFSLRRLFSLFCSIIFDFFFFFWNLRLSIGFMLMVYCPTYVLFLNRFKQIRIVVRCSFFLQVQRTRE